MAILRNEIVITHAEHKVFTVGAVVGRCYGDEGEGFPFLVEEGGVLGAAVVEVEAGELGGVVEVCCGKEEEG